MVLRAQCGTLGQSNLSELPPNRRVGSHPAHLSPPDAPALWLWVQQKPGVVLELSSYPPDQAPLSVVRAIAAALTDDPSVPGVPAPTDTCTALLQSYRVTPPAGFRLVSERRDDEVGTRSLRFQRNSALVSVEIACPAYRADLSPDGVAVAVPYGKAELTAAGGKPQVVWQAEPKLVVFVDPAQGQVTKDDVLAFLAGTRRS